MINLYYTFHKIDEYSFGIPTASGNIQELDINNQMFTVVKEDNQLKAFYIDDKMMCNLFTYNITYAEADRILYSFS